MRELLRRWSVSYFTDDRTDVDADINTDDDDRDRDNAREGWTMKDRGNKNEENHACRWPGFGLSNFNCLSSVLLIGLPLVVLALAPLIDSRGRK